VSERLNRRKIDLIPTSEWADPRKADIDRLLKAVDARLAAVGIANLSEIVSLAFDVSRSAGLAGPRVTSDVKHIEIGLTDKSDSARWSADWLARRGVTGGLVLLAGDEFGPVGGVVGSDSLMMVKEFARAVVVSVGVEPGGAPERVLHLGSGPKGFIDLLDDQLLRRATRRVPNIDLDPAWVLPLPAAESMQRVAESLGTLSNGLVGVRGSREEGGEGSAPLTLVNGIYGEEGLLHAPDWTGLERPSFYPGHSERRVLDLRGGSLVRFDDGTVRGRSLRFVSAASPHVMGLRAEGPAGDLQPGYPLRRPRKAVEYRCEERNGAFAAITGEAGVEISVVARDRTVDSPESRIVERLVSWQTSPINETNLETADHLLEIAEHLGFDRLLAEHRESWAQRWSDTEVTIEGDPESELAARFALFHLLSATGDTGEMAVGARGLTGDAYAGHVFWDADVFVLPALAAISPISARAMLEYRIRRLPAAQMLAKTRGFDGARFPWESARDGTDVTPRSVRGKEGELVPIATGSREEHIVADVAWSAVHYAAWTGDSAFLAGPGGDLVLETARYWASRIETDADGGGHLSGVIGPDEYHELVDDNAYTNVMARWNIRRGAEVIRQAGDVDTSNAWTALADSLVDGWDPERGIYEQFVGYFELEPLIMSEVAPPPVAADQLLGSERVSGSQLIKQADVLMLHHLVPEEAEAGSLEPCLAFYGPRTAHGSSLSPAVHASLLARAGDPERALELFRLAARLDLDDTNGTTDGGLHLATMGGVWQALAFGFLGVRAAGDSLTVRPCLPVAWHALALRFRFQGKLVRIRAEHDEVTITSDSPLLVRVGDREVTWSGQKGITVPL
jgi:trehalose/maltose hydrolase-like predicted phosphorylase